MELRTGRLMALAAGAAMAEGWAQVPADLEKLAQAKMRAALFSENNPPAQVNMRGHHPLARWGRDKRKEKAKAKTAAASRRRNRNGKR